MLYMNYQVLSPRIDVNSDRVLSLQLCHAELFRGFRTRGIAVLSMITTNSGKMVGRRYNEITYQITFTPASPNAIMPNFRNQSCISETCKPRSVKESWLKIRIRMTCNVLLVCKLRRDTVACTARKDRCSYIEILVSGLRSRYGIIMIKSLVKICMMLS